MMLKSGFKDGPLPWIEKDPAAVLDYTIDWNAASNLGGPWLAPGDAIVGAATWTVPSGVNKSSQVDTATASTIWLSGGTAGQSYTLTCKILTSAGRSDERSFLVVVKQR
jgi:hypothetical protein